MPMLGTVYRVVNDRIGLYLQRRAQGWGWCSSLRECSMWTDRESLLMDLRKVQSDPFLQSTVLDGSMPFIEGILEGETVWYSELPERIPG